MKYMFVFLILFPIFGIASVECFLAAPEAVKKYSNHMDTYLRDVILSAYKSIDPSCKISYYPGKRLAHLEGKAYFTSIIVSFDDKKLEKNFYKYPNPISKNTELLFVGDLEHSTKIGVINGVKHQRIYSKNYFKEAEIIYVDNIKVLINLYLKKRIDGFFILSKLLTNALRPIELEKIYKSSKLIDKINFYHYINKEFLKVHPQIIKKLNSAQNKESFEFQSYLKKINDLKSNQ